MSASSRDLIFNIFSPEDIREWVDDRIQFPIDSLVSIKGEGLQVPVKIRAAGISSGSLYLQMVEEPEFLDFVNRFLELREKRLMMSVDRNRDTLFFVLEPRRTEKGTVIFKIKQPAYTTPKRKHARVDLSEHLPVEARVDGEEVILTDISRGGLGIRTSQNLADRIFSKEDNKIRMISIKTAKSLYQFRGYTCYNSPIESHENQTKVGIILNNSFNHKQLLARLGLGQSESVYING